MTDAIQSLPALPYRALTGEKPEVLGEKVNEAIQQGYSPFGKFEFAIKYGALEPFSTPYFLQLVLNETRIRVISPLRTSYKEFKVVRGGIDRAFCEKVSHLLIEEGWLLQVPPKIYVQKGEFQLFQVLVKI